MTKTWADLTREIGAQYGYTELNDDIVELILWEMTAFPFAGEHYVARQLHKAFAKVKRERTEYGLRKAVLGSIYTDHTHVDLGQM